MTLVDIDKKEEKNEDDKNINIVSIIMLITIPLTSVIILAKVFIIIKVRKNKNYPKILKTLKVTLCYLKIIPSI